MFTGIIEAVGNIQQLQPLQGDLRLQVATGKLDLADVKLGDSIAVNGVCLTVIELHKQAFWADVSAETLRCTTFQELTVGQKVNLEKALTPTTRLGGHLVSGHVDGLGQIVEIKQAARSVFFKLKAPLELAKYIAAKGSITVDGTSLTVNAVHDCNFELNIIPQTLAETIFGSYKVAHLVNLEVDLLARYLERLLVANKTNESENKSPSVTAALLKEHGFIRS
ncbi:riboflavin synthase [Entomomonas asaccharolytica]|uniref:Riboflavin synthase n=1 Tax=Entomomonas asaccharolytica TaxID=2785331 RepID=A0A974RW05_9GAMM|nr:riboflavin synthase [Entomomonas asaccharolytica]QQP84592.1 riboflavin synthase [Entomomonas asaccharolytica]